jgi:hypothetical protein
MPHLVQHPHLVALCALAASAVLGLVGLLAPGRPALLAAALRLAAAAGHARFQAALLFLGGFALLGGLLLPCVFGTGALARLVARSEIQVHLTDVPAGALTDAGHAIPLGTARLASEADATRGDSQLIEKYRLAGQVIQTGPAGLECNCHGWVFTAGRYWVHGTDVERILKDNGYRPVSNPQPGDLAIWRNPWDAVSHSGLVRSAAADGELLVESKWGRGGRYVHTPTRHPYPHDRCTFYHSPRGGHLLLGVAVGDVATR